MQKSKKLVIKAIKSPIITSKDNLEELLQKLLRNGRLKDKDILVLASKVVAITQGRVREIRNQEEFEALVKSEADRIIGGFPVTLTLKNNIFIPWAGIDRSNVRAGQVVLWPKKSFQAAEKLRKALLKKFKLKNLGIIIADSFCVPMRRGVSAVTLGHSGFQGVRDLRGQKDLYGNTLKVSQQALADNLATAASVMMGESNESCPFAIIRNAPVEFTNKKIDPESLTMGEGECLFGPLYGFGKIINF
jgi:coenzyme F420-0:L-glutamate ligase